MIPVYILQKEGRGFEISDDIDSRKKTGFKVVRPV